MSVLLLKTDDERTLLRSALLQSRQANWAFIQANQKVTGGRRFDNAERVAEAHKRVQALDVLIDRLDHLAEGIR